MRFRIRAHYYFELATTSNCYVFAIGSHDSITQVDRNGKMYQTGHQYFRTPPDMEKSYANFNPALICAGSPTQSHQSVFASYPMKPSQSKDSAPLPPPSELKKKREAASTSPKAASASSPKAATTILKESRSPSKNVSSHPSTF
jgi:hypothetical protein